MIADIECYCSSDSTISSSSAADMIFLSQKEGRRGTWRTGRAHATRAVHLNKWNLPWKMLADMVLKMYEEIQLAMTSWTSTPGDIIYKVFRGRTSQILRPNWNRNNPQSRIFDLPIAEIKDDSSLEAQSREDCRVRWNSDHHIFADSSRCQPASGTEGSA